MTLAILGDQLYQSSDVFLIGLLLGAEEAGIYATLYRFPAAWVALVGLLSSGWLRSAAARSLPRGGMDLNIRQALKAGRLAAVGIVVLLPAVYLLVPPIPLVYASCRDSVCQYVLFLFVLLFFKK